MKTRSHLLFLGLIAGLLSSAALADDEGSTSLFGMFYVAAVKGTAECISDGRIWDLQKGDKVLARGSSIKTDDKSNVTLLFSNQVTMFLDAKTEFKVRKFEQEPFSPNNNLAIEPSNSQTLIGLVAGGVLVNTPQLLTGTHLIFETPHAQISILNNQSGSEKAFIDVTPLQTHVAVIAGLVGVKARQANGQFTAINSPVPVNQQAFIKYTLNGTADTKDTAVTAMTIGSAQDAGGAALANSGGEVGEFRVGKITGRVDGTPAHGPAAALKDGDHFPAAGISLKVAAGAKATLYFDNGSSYALSAGTDLKIDKFTQEPFAANNDLAIEPSVSQTHLTLNSGSLEISTPQLLAGTHLVIETPHAGVALLDTPAGGDRAFVEVNPKQTHVQLEAGKGSVQPRDAQGKLAQTYYLDPDQQAFIKPTLAAGAANTAAAAQLARSAIAIVIAPVPTVAAGVPTVTRPAEATVLKVVGAVQFRLSSQGAAAPLVASAKLPQGAIVITGAGAEAYLRPFDGAVAVLRPNSQMRLERLELATAGGVIVKQIARLDLQKGTMVSELDPAKRNLDDYSVRTPKGIATAHGTSFTVSVTGNDPSCTSTADTVTFTNTDGSVYSINAGFVTMTPPGGTPQPPVPLAQAVAASPAFAGVVQQAVTTIAAVVQNNIGNLPANSAANLISQIVSIASTAVPAQASSFASQAVAAVTAPGSSTAQHADGAAAAVTSAAVTAAPTQAAQITGSAVQALSQSSAGSTQQGETRAAAIVTAAASAAAPTQSTSIASAATSAVEQAEPQANPTQVAAVINQAAAAGVAVSTDTSVTGGSSGGNAGGGNTGGNNSGTAGTGSSTSGSTGNTASSGGGSSGTGGNGGTQTSTSITISASVGSTGTSTANNVNTAQPASITVVQLNGSQLTQASAALTLTQSAQGSATFNTTSGNGTTTGGNPTVTVNAVTPTTPTDVDTVSPATR